MKKFITVLLIACLVMLPLAGCGDNKKLTINGTTGTYETYGLFNQDTDKNPNVDYEIIIGNVVWSIILFETIIAPIYFLGFSLYEPVGVKGTKEPGTL